MNKLEKAKEIIVDHYIEVNYGIFDNHNIAGDRMNRIYEDEELIIDICFTYKYFEVFGLTEEEFQELEEFYNSLEIGGK